MRKWKKFPKGTKIRTMKIEDGTAYVDFSKEITNVPQGSYTELMLTTAIVNTLTEFPEIKNCLLYTSDAADE